jgi:hypothetical protein
MGGGRLFSGLRPVLQNSKFKIQNEADAQKKIKARTAEFADKGRRGGGGLKNGDLLIASKVRSIHFTDDDVTTPQIVPCGLFVQLFRKKLREK